MLTSGRSSVSAGVSGSLPASSRFMSGWCESSATISSDGTGSSPRSSGSTLVASDGSGSRSSGLTAGSVSNWGLVPQVHQRQVPFPRSVRFEAKRTGGRTAGATPPHERMSLRVHVGTHQQVLLPLKPNSRPQELRKPVYVWYSRCPSTVARSDGSRRPPRDSRARYVPQRQVVFFEELGPSCLPWRQRSRTCLEVSKTFVVSVYVHLLRSSK